jgi:hypothetical protein
VRRWAGKGKARAARGETGKGSQWSAHGMGGAWWGWEDAGECTSGRTASRNVPVRVLTMLVRVLIMLVRVLIMLVRVLKMQKKCW